MPRLDGEWQEWLAKQTICGRCNDIVELGQWEPILVKGQYGQVLRRVVCSDCATTSARFVLTEAATVPGVAMLCFKYGSGIEGRWR